MSLIVARITGLRRMSCLVRFHLRGFRDSRSHGRRISVGKVYEGGVGDFCKRSGKGVGWIWMAEMGSRESDFDTIGVW